MRILFLTPSVPYPPDQGARIRNLALIRAAAEHHQVDVLSFAAPDAVEPGRSELAAICRSVQLVPLPDRRGFVRRGWSLFFDQLPDIGRRLESGAFGTALERMLDAQQYDVIQIEGLEMIPFLGIARGGGRRAAVIYDAHNAEMFLQRTMFQADFKDPVRWPAALYSLAQWSKLGSYERIMMNETSMVLAVSDIDVAKLRGRRVEPQLVPNGVDATAIPYREPSAVSRGALLFVGSLDYRPNADAARWLIRRIMPSVRARLPDARLRVVGKGSEQLSGEGVEGVGHVQDMGAELDRADVAVIPVRMGSGVRFKALDAMAAGLPVVSTTLGVSGIAAEHERHVLIADEPSAFAASILRVLEDRALARQLAQQARRLIEGRYDWSRITPTYLRLLSTARRARHKQS